MGPIETTAEVSRAHTPRRSTRTVRPVRTDTVSLQATNIPSSAKSVNSGNAQGRQSSRTNERPASSRGGGKNVISKSVSAPLPSVSLQLISGDASDMRRIELLNRLNQIERQRNELNRLNSSLRHGTAGGLTKKTADGTQNAGGLGSQIRASGSLSSKRHRPFSSGDIIASDNKRPRSETVVDWNAVPASSENGPRSRRSKVSALPLQNSPAVSARAQTNAEGLPALALDLGAIDVLQNSGSPNDLTDPESRKFGRGANKGLSEGDTQRFFSSGSPPESPGSVARGSNRVRTPSVLLTKQPGEGPADIAVKSTSMNNQVLFCLRLVKDMLRLKDAYAFSKPIDQIWPLDQLPGYFEMIAKPMDLGSIREKLETGLYLQDSGDASAPVFESEIFATDMQLVFENAKLYNRPGDMFYEAAVRLSEKFAAKFSNLPPLKDSTPGSSKKAKKKKADNARSASGGGGSKRHDNNVRSSPARRNKAKNSTSARQSGKTKSENSKTKSGPSKRTSNQSRKSDSEISASPKDITRMTNVELERRLDALKRHVAVVDSGSPARSPVSGKPAYLSQAQALYHLPMTFEEKYSLSQNVSRLPGDKLQKLVALVSKDVHSTMEVNNEEEIELDIDRLDNKTLRDMEAFVNHILFRKRVSSAKGTSGGIPGDLQHLSRKQIDDEISQIESILRVARSNEEAGNDSHIGRKTITAEVSKERSLYDDSDSSSESESGSSGSGSSDEDSDEGSESSDNESEESAKFRRRERNLEHMRQRGQSASVGGTPLPSPNPGRNGEIERSGGLAVSTSAGAVQAAKLPSSSVATSHVDTTSHASGDSSSESQ